MEVNLSPDLEGKLTRAAGRRGVSPEVLSREAIERAVDYDDGSSAKSRTDFPGRRRAEVLTHDAVGSRLDQKVADQQSRR